MRPLFPASPRPAPPCACRRFATRQIWKNAQKFNHDGSPLWIAAEHFKQQLDRLYKVQRSLGRERRKRPNEIEVMPPALPFWWSRLGCIFLLEQSKPLIDATHRERVLPLLFFARTVLFPQNPLSALFYVCKICSYFYLHV